MPDSIDAPPLVFGVYPGGMSGSDDGVAVGPPDDRGRIEDALTQLQDGLTPFVVRAYETYSDAAAPSKHPPRAPEGYEAYAREGRRLDLVLMFQSASGDVPAFLQFVREMIRRHGPLLYSVQVTEEANFVSGPSSIDGPYPRVREALVEGVQVAREELDRAGYGRSVGVGFSTTPTFGPSSEFWASVGGRGGRAFLDALDYVALDFFPDVFRPTAPDGEPGDVRDSVLHVLRALREEWLPAAGIPASVSIHIGENGWPTGPMRTYERQARVLETVIRTIHERRRTYNIARYTLFDLRDASSTETDIWHQFGVMRDDYTPKPAFETYRRLVKELGGRVPTCGPRPGGVPPSSAGAPGS
jgi:hypothetical protein